MGMRKTMRLLRNFLRCEDGGTGMEYALIAGGISIIIAAGVHGISDATEGTFTNVADAFPNP